MTTIEMAKIAFAGCESVDSQFFAEMVRKQARADDLITKRLWVGQIKTCRASELINRLGELVDQYGDLPVYACDPDTLIRLPIGLMYRDSEPDEDRPARFEITSDYYDVPLGKKFY